MRRAASMVLGVLGVLLGAVACAGGPPPLRPAAYGVELEECNRRASSCRESIECENEVRARYGRPARALDGCR